MEPLPEVWPSASADFYSFLLKNELKLEQPVDARERRLCVTWIVRACSDYGFRPATGGLAVKYFDTFMDKTRRTPGFSLNELTFKQLVMKVGASVVDTGKHKESQVCELICICCIAIAAKKTEAKEKAPFLGDFDENFTFPELRSMEHTVLCALEWNFVFSTPYDYVHFWLQRAERGVDRDKTLVLCHEAIAKCIIEPEFAQPRSANHFGAGVILWAYHAQELCTEALESLLDSIICTEHKTHHYENLELALEQIGSHMRDSYPAGFRPRRSGSPTNVMGVTSMVSFSDGVVDKQGVKRPTPEQFSDRSPRAPNFVTSNKIQKTNITHVQAMISRVAY